MDSTLREKFFALHNAHTLDGSGPILGEDVFPTALVGTTSQVLLSLTGVIHTNSWKLEALREKGAKDQAGEYLGVGALVSRFNHRFVVSLAAKLLKSTHP